MISPEDEELAGPGGEDPGDWDPFAEYGDDYEIQLTPDDPSPRPVPQAGPTSQPAPVQGFMSKKYTNHIKTTKSLIIIFDTGAPITVFRDSPQYQVVSDLIDQGRFHEVAEAMDKAYGIYTKSKGKFLVEDHRVKIDGELLPQALSTRLIQFIDNNIPTGPLEEFWNNLLHNTSENSKQDLYTFLEVNHIPLTEDGCFIGYKRVGGDYKDLYTKKIDNSPGKVVSMPRDQVDPNRHNTCSTGLHVAAFGYAAKEYGTGGTNSIREGRERLLKVKVNPKDVVAVPPDYNAQKMRVCRYEVIGDLNQTKPLTAQVEPTPTRLVEDEEVLHDEEITEEVEQKLEQKRVTKVRFKPITVDVDAEGRLRIPGYAIRQIDVGVGKKVVALVENARSRNIKLVKATKSQLGKGAKASRVYVAQTDNSVRIPPSFLAEAKIDGKEQYTVRLTQGSLEIRPA